MRSIKSTFDRPGKYVCNLRAAYFQKCTEKKYAGTSYNFLYFPYEFLWSSTFHKLRTALPSTIAVGGCTDSRMIRYGSRVTVNQIFQVHWDSIFNSIRKELMNSFVPDSRDSIHHWMGCLKRTFLRAGGRVRDDSRRTVFYL